MIIHRISELFLQMRRFCPPNERLWHWHERFNGHLPISVLITIQALTKTVASIHTIG